MPARKHTCMSCIACASARTHMCVCLHACAYARTRTRMRVLAHAYLLCWWVGTARSRPTNKHNNTTIAPACICILQLECTHSILFWSHPDFLYVRAYAYACECICVCVHMRVRVNATSLHMRLCFPDEVGMVAPKNLVIPIQ